MCNPWHWDLAASLKGHVCITGAQLQYNECYNTTDCSRRPCAYHRILRLLWRHHGEQVHAGHGMITLLCSGFPLHIWGYGTSSNLTNWVIFWMAGRLFFVNTITQNPQKVGISKFARKEHVLGGRYMSNFWYFLLLFFVCFRKSSQKIQFLNTRKCWCAAC